MPTIDDFYTVSGTSEDLFTEPQMVAIGEVLPQITQAQLLPTAYFLIDIFVSQQKSVTLRAHAKRLLLQLAEAGVAEYQCELGERLLNGLTSPPKGQDAAQAAQAWLQKAYAQGYGRAAYALGYFYEENRKGFVKDEQKAVFYRQEAIRLGYDAS